LTQFLYLIRHGRTDANQQNRLIGRRGAHELTTLGREQVVTLSRKLANEGIDAVRCSPLRRAVQTAQEIESQTGIPFVIDQSLVERDYATFDGMTRPDLLAARARCGLDNVDPTGYFPAAAGGVEPLAEVQRRMLEACHNALFEQPGAANVGVISHAGTIKAFLYAVLGIPEEHPRAVKLFQASFAKCKVPELGRYTLHEIWRNPVQ
jgi:ribonuclease H / adenosylcobalamin/alpha-ribazole phosphatase